MTLISHRAGPVEHLTLNRPEVRNALSDALLQSLTQWAATIAGDASVRAVVLTGAGTVFCAGADLGGMSRVASKSEDENRRDAEILEAVFAMLDRLPVPLIGRIHGAAMGGGAGLVALCDVAVSGESAVFAFPEVKLGIMPAVIAPYVLAKIGVSAARDLFLTGRRFDATRAREIGLVHTVVPDEDLDRAVDAVVREVLTAAPGAVAAAKDLVRGVSGVSPDSAASLTTRAIAARRVSREGQEGMRAFLEKRRPSWYVPTDPGR